MFLIEILLIVLIKIVLEYSYINFVSTVFGYAGFLYDFELNKYIIGWFIYIIVYLLVYLKKKLFIYEVFIFMFLLYILPLCTFFGLSNQNISSLFLLTIPFLVILLLTFNLKFYSIKTLPYSKVIIIGTSFLFTFLVLINYYLSTGGKMVLSLSDVYIFRDEFGKYSSEGIFGYLNNWVTKIFVVLLFSWAIYRKKFFLFLAIILVFLLLFALSGHKSVLSGFFLVLFFYIMFKFKHRNFIILLGFLTLLIFTILIDYLFDIYLLQTLIVRRLLFVPAHLNFIYLEFFSSNQFVFWSNGLLSSFIDYPYDTRIVQVIGSYIGKPDMAANTGFIASGYSHAGVLGIFIYMIISIILINIINNLGRKTDKYFVFSIIFIPIMTMFISSDLLTSLLTHGLILSVLIIWLYNNKDYIVDFKILKYKI